jgi:hypothetical protein
VKLETCEVRMARLLHKDLARGRWANRMAVALLLALVLVLVVSVLTGIRELRMF